MRLIAILVLAFGAALAGGAIYYADQYFAAYEERMRNSQPQGPEMTKVIVAKAPLRYGMAIEPNEHLRWADWPADSLPQGVFTDAIDLLGPKEERDENKRFVLRDIEPGEPILQNKITGFGAQMRMAMNLGQGRRAFSIRIDAVSGVSGFVNPGDRVDILMTRTANRSLESVVILENIEVIAVDQQTNDQRNAPTLGRTATVDVSVDQAQKLALAQQVGKLSLTLRGFSPEDVAEEEGRSEFEPRRVSVDDLLGIKEEEAQPQQTIDERTRVRVRRAGQVNDTVIFDEDN